MTNMKRIVKLYIAFGFFHFTTAESALDLGSITRKYNLGGRKFVESKNNKDTVTFANCDFERNADIWNCTVIQNRFNVDGSQVEKKCNMGFELPSFATIDLFKLSAENNRSVVFSYSIFSRDKEFLEIVFRIVNMDSCQYDETTFPMFDFSKLDDDHAFDVCRLWNLQVLPYFDGTNETYDTFLPNFGQCDGAVCRVTFDSKGEIINHPVSFLPKDLHAYDAFVHPPLDTRLPAKNFFVFVLNFDSSKMKNLGNFSEKLEAEVSSHAVDHDNIVKLKFIKDGNLNDLLLMKSDNPQSKALCIATDSSHELFSLCWAEIGNNKSIQCVKYDNEGQKKLDTQVDLYHDGGFKIYNSEKYGLVFVTIKFTDLHLQNPMGLVMTQIKDDGSIGKSWELPTPECNTGKLIFFNMAEMKSAENTDIFTLTIDCPAKQIFVQKQYQLN